MANLMAIQSEMDTDVKESGGGFDVLPGGQYKMVIVGDELKDNRAGNGKLLVPKLQVVEGAHAGVTIPDYINLTNPNKQCQEIGQGTLKKICRLCNVQYPPTDTTTLYGKPMSVKVAVQSFKSNTTGNDLQSNNVKSYSEVKSQAAPVAAATQSADLPW